MLVDCGNRVQPNFEMYVVKPRYSAILLSPQFEAVCRVDSNSKYSFMANFLFANFHGPKVRVALYRGLTVFLSPLSPEQITFGAFPV